ncbi:MAG: MFS transporter, partial [Chloroflexota bacterium]
GNMFFLTLNLLQVQGFTAFAAGLAMLPITTSIFILSTPMGRLTDRWGARPLLNTGIVVTLVSFLMFARLGLEDNYWTSFFPATVVFGIGIGIIVVPMTIVLLEALPSRFSGIASGSNYAATRIGNMLAIAIFGAVMLFMFQTSLSDRIAEIPLDSTSRTELLHESRNLGATAPPTTTAPELVEATTTAIKLAFVDSFQAVMYVCAGLMGLSLLITLFFIPGRAKKAMTELS